MATGKNPAWVYQGKSVRQVLEELNTFECLDLEVFVSIDYGDSCFPLMSIQREGACYLLCSCDGERKGSTEKHLEEENHRKKIWQLIKDLQLLDFQELEARICIDFHNEHKPISLLEKKGNFCLLTSCSDFYDKK
jgi:hypothetical protein